MTAETIKKRLGKIIKGERGQLLIMVLIFLALGGLLLGPLLSHMATGLETTRMYRDKSHELYSADAGIEDGIWQIKYDDLESLNDPKPYTMYDFGTTWNYTVGGVNELEDACTIENVWIPKDISAPSETSAQDIIEGTGGEPPYVIITGRITASETYRITLNYYPEDSESGADTMEIEKIGIWFPPGFSYDQDGQGGGDFEPWLENNLPGQYDMEISDHNGGEAVVWTFSGVTLDDFPDLTGSEPYTSHFTLDFDGPAGREPQAVSWIDTTLEGVGSYYTWDADVRVFRITSETGGTAIEAYTAKTEMRELGSSIAGDYYAFGNSLMEPTYHVNPDYRDRLHEESTTNIEPDALPADAQIDAAYLYWAGWIDYHNYEPSTGGDTVIFYDPCGPNGTPGDLDNGNWDYGSDWDESSYTGFYVHNSHTGNEILTLSYSLSLAEYSDSAVTISWQNRTWHESAQDSTDCFQYSFYNASGWSDWQDSYCGDFGTSFRDFSTTIPSEYLTDDFKMRFRVENFGGTDEYCYINEVLIVASDAVFSDDCSDFSAPPVNWSNGNRWSIYDNRIFLGQGGGGSSDRTLEMSQSLDLSSYAGTQLTIYWDQMSTDMENGEGLDFAFSSDGGSTWSSYVRAFDGYLSSSWETYSYTIPEDYLTSDFRMKYLIDANYYNYDHLYIDNIIIAEGGGSLEYPENDTTQNLTTLIEETARVNTVMFNDTQVTAEDWAVLETAGDDFDGEWSYTCFYDATDLVNQWIEDEDLESNGTGTYTLGHVVADNEEDPSYSFELYPTGETGYPLGTPAYNYSTVNHQYCYVGWSVILIYTSPETKGHQLYLYDIRNPNFTFAEAWGGSYGVDDIDFDGDGEDGGSISGFLAPDTIDEEVEAARITVFIGEGDEWITDDEILANGDNLSNSESPTYNVWNSRSPGMSVSGVDIDTFSVEYPTVQPGDTSAEINLPTHSDGIELIYVILSFRSDVVTGGAISYLIQS